MKTKITLALVVLVGVVLSGVLLWHSWREKEGARQQRAALRLWDTDDREGALARLEEAYPALKRDSKFLHDYGRRLRETGQPERALKVLEEARQLRPDPFTLEQIARTHYDLGDLDAAVRAAEKARAMLPWRLTVKHLLAGYYEEAGDTEKAIESIRALLVTPMKTGTDEGIALKTETRRKLLQSPLVLQELSPVPAGLLQAVSAENQLQFRRAFLMAGDNVEQLIGAFEQLAPRYHRALEFLIVNMPESDLVSLSADFLTESVRLAYEARDSLPFVSNTPEDIFVNYVLPYSQAGETRDRWRRDFRQRFYDFVKDSRTVEAAVVRLNEGIFEQLGVGYSERGEKVSQSPFESIVSGRAHCYGMSILLANACRAVGIPARITTIPGWVGISGGHGWVEVYDKGRWRFIGAFDQSPLDQTWFRKRASQTDPSHPRHRIYAASFARTDTLTTHFGASVWWTDVTGFYTSLPPLASDEQ